MSFIKRLKEEHFQLEEKVIKLSSFLLSEKSNEISEFQLTMLKIQILSMSAYLTCLESRILDLGKNDDSK